MIGDFESTVSSKQAFYYAASKAEQTDAMARIWWKRPPFHMQFLNSWTTNREEVKEDGADTD